jgi:recombination protein RecA
MLSKYQYYVGDKVPPIQRLPSGILAFDIVTGGGIPIGRFTEFYGDKSTGKSTTSLRFINQFLQRDDRKAVYLDFENTYDAAWAKCFIQDLDRVIVVQPDYGELGVDLFIELHKHADEIGFIILDSLAMIIPTKEVDDDALAQHVATQARLVSSMLRRALPCISKNNQNKTPITVILLNQIRMKIGGYGQPNQVTKPCGKMQDAVVSMDIRFYSKEYKVVSNVPVSVTHQINVEKNKVGGHPKRTAQFKICLVPSNGLKIGDCEDNDLYLAMMKKLHLIQRDGNKWVYNGNIFKNLIEVEEQLLHNPEIKQQLYHLILDKVTTDLSLLVGDDEDA